MFAQITVGQIKAGFIETENAIVNNILLAKNIIVQGKNYFPGGGDRGFENRHHTTKNDDLTIDLSRPNGPNLTSQVESGALGRLIINGLNNKTVASIDAEGNATFAGTLTANEVYTEGLNARSATISVASPPATPVFLER